VVVYCLDMEDINGCTVITSSESPGVSRFGPAETGNAYVVEIGVFPPGEGPPLHKHPSTDEMFYVADGEATFVLGDRELPVTSGDLVFVPRGTAHTVWVSGGGPVRGLIVISPGDAIHEFVPVEAA